MKKLLLPLLAILFITVAHSQNVGIGTTTPPAKLTVIGTGNNASIPGATSTGIFRIGVSSNEGIDIGKMSLSPFSGWIQSGFNGTSADPLVLQPNGGAVGIGTTSPHASAVLDITSTTQGFLPPRMTAAQRTAISSPTNGLLVYQTDYPSGLYYFNSGVWSSVAVPTHYPSVTICSQKWMDKNLDVTTYRNGDTISYVTDPAAWAALITGAWCYYNNDPSTNATYGKLYNWYAVNDTRGLAPAGWHVPSDAEWTTLVTCLGGSSVAGGKMKVTGTTTWASPNTGATNTSGWAGLPGGYRTNDGTFYNVGSNGYWWSSTEANTALAWYRNLYYDFGNITRFSYDKQVGFSVRCLRD